MAKKGAAKVAIFVHGWDANSAVWNKPKNNPNAIKRLFEDKGYLVLRFCHKDDWMKTLAAHQGIFGGMV